MPLCFLGSCRSLASHTQLPIHAYMRTMVTRVTWARDDVRAAAGMRLPSFAGRICPTLSTRVSCRFCTVGEAVGGKYALVCDQPAVSSAARFNLIPAVGGRHPTHESLLHHCFLATFLAQASLPSLPTVPQC